MNQKNINSFQSLMEYLFGHPARKLFTILAIIVLIPVTYCGICVASEYDTSRGGFMGALATVLSQLTGTPVPPPVASHIAAGDGGYVYYTVDGSTWTASQIAPAAVNFRSVVRTGKNYIVAGGAAASCEIYFSADGIAWTKSTITGTCSDTVNDLAARGSEVIGVGGMTTYASNPIELTSSNDGETWNVAPLTLALSDLLRIEFDGTYYLAATGTFSISVYRKLPGGAYAAAPINPLSGAKNHILGDLYRIPATSRVVAAGSRSVFTPPAGSDYSINSSTTWTANATAIFGGNINFFPRALAYGNGRLIAAGDSCMMDYSDDSTTSLTWNYNGTMTGCPAGVTWRGAVWDGNRFIAVGQTGGASPVGILAVSPTGNPNDWTIQTSGTPSLYGIAVK